MTNTNDHATLGQQQRAKELITGTDNTTTLGQLLRDKLDAVAGQPPVKRVTTTRDSGGSLVQYSLDSYHKGFRDGLHFLTRLAVRGEIKLSFDTYTSMAFVELELSAPVARMWDALIHLAFHCGEDYEGSIWVAGWSENYARASSLAILLENLGVD